MKDEKFTKEDMQKLIKELTKDATPEQLNELLLAMTEVEMDMENERRWEIYDKTGVTPDEQRNVELRKRMYWHEKNLKLEEKKKALEKKQQEEDDFIKLLEGTGDVDNTENIDDKENNSQEQKDIPVTGGSDSDNKSNNFKWVMLIAIFVLGIGGCFGGLILKGSKDAATSSMDPDPIVQNKNVEVTTSTPVEDLKNGSNDMDFLLNRLENYKEDPATEKQKTEIPPFNKLYKGEKKEEILEEKDLPNHDDPKFADKLFVRYKGYLYKKTEPTHQPNESTGDIDWYHDLEDFYNDKKKFYGEILPRMSGEYCHAVKSIEAINIGVVPYRHISDKKAEDLTITAEVNMIDVDFEYRARLEEIAMLRKMFFVFRYLLVDQTGNEKIENGDDPYDPEFNDIETYSGCKYQDTYWNQSGFKYKLNNFSPKYIDGFVKDLLIRNK